MIETFYKNNYYAISSKCFFFQKYIKFCEHVIKNDKIQMNEKKLKIIRDWSLLQTIHDIRFFLKLCVYYRKFIKDFVSITKSLYEFIQNVENKKFKSIIMNFFARKIFEIIKNVIYNDRILTQSNISRFFVIETNIFDFDWEIVLYQIDQNNKKRFIIFESKTFFLLNVITLRINESF